MASQRAKPMYRPPAEQRHSAFSSSKAEDAPPPAQRRRRQRWQQLGHRTVAAAAAASFLIGGSFRCVLTQVGGGRARTRGHVVHFRVAPGPSEKKHGVLKGALL